MPNQRAADQVFIGTWISLSLAKKINAARQGKGRSQWVREAIAKMLTDAGFEVSAGERSAPDRVGKIRKPTPGYRPKRQRTKTVEAAGGPPESANQPDEPSKFETATLPAGLKKDTAAPFLDKISGQGRPAKTPSPAKKR